MAQATPLTRCTIQRRNGEFCDADSIPDAPFPICTKHAAEIYGHLDAAIASFAQAATLTRPDVPTGAVVYYLAIGGLIKIGTSVNLARRLTAYPPNVELLATEPGGYAIETRRHKLFEHLRAYPKATREWYVDVPALRADIAAIGRGDAPLSAPPQREPHERRPDTSPRNLFRLDGMRRGGEGNTKPWDTHRTRAEQARIRATTKRKSH